MVSTQLSEGLTVGVEHLWPLVVLPVAVLVLAYLIFRQHDDRSAARRSRRLLFASRVLVVGLLVVGAMAPYTVQTRETAGEPRVTALADESDSMAVYPNVSRDVADAVQSEGVPVSTATIGTGSESRIGDGLSANLRENGTVVLVSDGRVTDGRRLQAVTETARQLNATVHAVDLEAERVERAVSIDGPTTASVGLETEFTVSLSGVAVDGPVPVEVTIDNETVETTDLEADNATAVRHTFEERGPHRVTATIAGGDVYERNDVYYHSVRVVEKPDLLYVAPGEYPLQGYLSSLYDVTNASSVPDDLEGYQTVVVQDVPAPQLGNVSHLQEYVIGGGGLVVVGGENAYESGGYGESPVGTLLPVRMGNATGGRGNIVMAIDVSGSAQSGLTTQKAVALDVLDQLGDENQVGVVAFNHHAHRVSDLQALSSNRQDVADRIRRLEAGGGTDIGNALLGADELLGDRQGTIILLSDGHEGTPGRGAAVANQLGREGQRIITVGAGNNIDVTTMERIAGEADGSYYGATERSRLRLLFGGASRQFESEKLTVVTPGTFITSNVDLTVDPSEANDVAVKSGADHQVATGEGNPAIVSWQFGLGRVVSLTSYDSDGSLGGLLDRPDSLVVTRSVNYAIGDPTRTTTGVTSVGDARVGQPTGLTYRGDDRPNDETVTFRQTGENTYRGEFTPPRAGYNDILGTAYAANYPAEYSQFGRSRALSTLVETTGGQVFSPTDGAEIARLAREQATQVRTVRQTWDWVALILALLLFVTEVCARRVQVYRGQTSRESGLL